MQYFIINLDATNMYQLPITIVNQSLTL